MTGLPPITYSERRNKDDHLVRSAECKIGDEIYRFGMVDRRGDLSLDAFKKAAEQVIREKMQESGLVP